MAHEGRVRVQTTRRLAANHLFKATIQQSYCNRSSRVHTGSSTEKTKRFSRNRSVVPGERVEDDDGHAAVIPAGGLGLVVALHGDVVVEGARRQPHQPATKTSPIPRRSGTAAARVTRTEQGRGSPVEGLHGGNGGHGETGASGFGLRFQGMGGREGARSRWSPAAAGAATSWIEATDGRAMEREKGGVHRFGIRPGNKSRS